MVHEHCRGGGMMFFVYRNKTSDDCWRLQTVEGKDEGHPRTRTVVLVSP